MEAQEIFDKLEEINSRPQAFEFYTASDLWTDEHISKQMLSFHLNSDIDASSRKLSFINRSAEWIIAQFDIRDGKSVIDFGCGPGLYTERFAKTKATITGIDFSKNSIEYAQNRARDERLGINYIHQNYLEFNSRKKHDLITMIYCDYCVLNPEQRNLLLEKFRALLKPGGSILLDVSSINAFDRAKENTMYKLNPENNFWSKGKNHEFLSTFKYYAEKVTLDKYIIIEESRTKRIFNWLQHYDQKSVAKEFSENGLKIVKYLANVAGDEFNADEDEFAVIAQAGN